MGRTAFKLNHHSPTILAGVAVVGVVTTAVLAVKSSSKVDQITADHEAMVEEIRDTTPMDAQTREMARAFFLTGVKLTHAFLPAIVSGAATITCIVGSNRISTKRYLAMAAAYKGLEETFANYRNRVIEEYGEEKELALSGPRKIERETVDENGNKIKEVDIVSGTVSQYARVFEKGNVNWQYSRDVNDLFLRGQQSYFNDVLRIKGHVVLNDIYNALGFPATAEGYVVGWVWEGDGDNFVDFGLDKGIEMAFDGGGIPLDFNVDGFINDKI